MNSLPINNQYNMPLPAEALLFRFPEILRIDLIHNPSFLDPIGNNVTAEPTTPSYFEIRKKEDSKFYLKTHNFAIRLDEIAIATDEFVNIMPGQIINLNPSLKAPCLIFVITNIANEENLKNLRLKLKYQAELTCSICTEIFNECVTLDCMHNFCAYCILNHLHSRQSQPQEISETVNTTLNSQSCPICKETFKSFIKNPAMNNLCQAFLSEHPKDQISQEKITRDAQSVKAGFEDRNGDRYSGYWKNRKKNGLGTMTFKSGDIFQGMFENDLMKKGRMTYSTQIIYEGDWKNDKRDGKGVLKYSRGGKQYEYQGPFVKDKMHGLGILRVKDENSLISGLQAQFIEGRPENKGKLKYKDRGLYEGDLMNGTFLRHGFGKMTFPDKNVYEGEWKDNHMHGPGVMVYSSGCTYRGQWLNGIEEGEGEMIYTNGEICLGRWVDGKFVKNAKTALEDQETSLEISYESDNAFVGGYGDLDP